MSGLYLRSSLAGKSLLCLPLPLTLTYQLAKGGTNAWDLSLVVVVVVIVVLVVVRNLILPNLAKACRGVVEPIDDCCSYKIEKERDQTWECWASFVL